MGYHIHNRWYTIFVAGLSFSSVNHGADGTPVFVNHESNINHTPPSAIGSYNRQSLINYMDTPNIYSLFITFVDLNWLVVSTSMKNISQLTNRLS